MWSVLLYWVVIWEAEKRIVHFLAILKPLKSLMIRPEENKQFIVCLQLRCAHNRRTQCSAIDFASLGLSGDIQMSDTSLITFSAELCLHISQGWHSDRAREWEAMCGSRLGLTLVAQQLRLANQFGSSFPIALTKDNSFIIRKLDFSKRTGFTDYAFSRVSHHSTN